MVSLLGVRASDGVDADAVLIAPESTSPLAPAHASSDDPVLQQPALERPVEERDAPARLQADELREARGVAGEDVAPPARKPGLKRIPEPRIERCELLVLAEPHAVGGIGDQHPGRRRRRELEDVRLLELDHSGETGALDRGARLRELGAVQIGAMDRHGRALELACARLVAKPPPERRVEPGELLEAKRTSGARREPERDAGSFDEERAAPAHRVEERLARLPAGEREDPRREVLADWRLAGPDPPATLPQRLAGNVEVERDGARVQESVDANIRHARVHVRPSAGVRAEAIADRVLHAQRHELEALHRRADRGDVDADRAPDVKALGPRDGEGRLVDVLVVCVRRVGYAPQDARRDSGPKIRPVAGCEIAFEVHAPAGGPSPAGAAGIELAREHFLETARAGGEERLQGHREALLA